jgi:hypothetical protein
LLLLLLQMEISGMLSTSNVIDGPEVVVELDGPCLWMTEVADKPASQ